MPWRRARRRDISSRGTEGLGKLGPGGTRLVMKSGGVRAVRVVRSVASAASAAVVSVGRKGRRRRRVGRRVRVRRDRGVGGQCMIEWW